jgi:hypothetical protein
VQSETEIVIAAQCWHVKLQAIKAMEHHDEKQQCIYRLGFVLCNMLDHWLHAITRPDVSVGTVGFCNQQLARTDIWFCGWIVC